MACKKSCGIGAFPVWPRAGVLWRPSSCSREVKNQAAQPTPQKARGKEVSTTNCGLRDPESEGCQFKIRSRCQKGHFRPRGSSCSSTKPWAAAGACRGSRVQQLRVHLLVQACVNKSHIRLGIRKPGRHPWAKAFSVLQHPSAAAGLISKDRWQANAAEFGHFPVWPRVVCRESPSSCSREVKINAPATASQIEGASNLLPPVVLEGTRDQRDANQSICKRPEKGGFEAIACRQPQRRLGRLGLPNHAPAGVSVKLGGQM